MCWNLKLNIHKGVMVWYNPIFDSWKSKKTATNLVNMGCVAVFYLASMCAIF